MGNPRDRHKLLFAGNTGNDFCRDCAQATINTLVSPPELDLSLVELDLSLVELDLSLVELDLSLVELDLSLVELDLILSVYTNVEKHH